MCVACGEAGVCVRLFACACVHAVWQWWPRSGVLVRCAAQLRLMLLMLLAVVLCLLLAYKLSLAIID